MLQKRYTSHAKWILLGEHAVLRGSPALVFPWPYFKLFLTVKPADVLTVSVKAPIDVAVGLLLESLLRRALNLQGCVTPLPNCSFELSGNLPPGQGLGFSAALSALVAQWSVGFVSDSAWTVVQLTQALEHAFHGVSSGVDAVGVLAQVPQFFYHIKRYEPLILNWQPQLYVSLAARATRTDTCVNQVMAQCQANPRRMAIVDGAMQQAVQQAHAALLSGRSDVLALAQAICQGQRCFNIWGLVASEQAGLVQHLYDQGAIAVKLTGAGGAGCLLSLWQQPPPSTLGLVSVFGDFISEVC